MAVLFYNIGIFFFNLLLVVASLFNEKAKKIIAGRKETWRKINRFGKQNSKRVVWFHAASVGEFEQGRPVMEKLKTNFPDVAIVLTFFSSSGYELRKNYEGADLIVYLPSDSASNAKRFLESVQPSVAIIIKYEFWFHFINESKKLGVHLLSVSTILRASQPFFKFYGGLHRSMLRSFDHFFVQDENTHTLLHSIGVEQSTVSGDTRFDRVVEIAKVKKEIEAVKSFKGNEKLMVLGSVWPSDMEMLTPFISKYHKEIKFVIAPHNVEKKEVDDLVVKLGLEVMRYSERETKNPEDYLTLVIDNIGLLSSIYGYADYAYVGGAFRKTLHNTLEAAVFGIPVFFGDDPTNQKFREAIELEKAGAGFAIPNADELTSKFQEVCLDEVRYEKVGKLAADYVRNNTGATEKIVRYLSELRVLTKKESE